MRWSLPFLLFLLPLGGLQVTGKRHGRSKFRRQQCKQSSLKTTNTTNSAHNSTPTSTAHKSVNTTQASTNTGRTYTLQDFYQGNSFLSSDWNYYSQPDPTHGNVVYQTMEGAIQQGLAVVENGVAILSVDDTTTLPAGGNRASIRISSAKTYSSGLFIADFAAMPFGCSLWPAYWSVGPNWPNAGEIDIIEGVNNQATNQMTLHSGPDCSMPPAGKSPATSNLVATGRLLATTCTSSPDSNSGCAFLDNSSQSFGKGFNDAGGGIFAHLWNDDGISMWHFPRNSIPGDITAKKPNPSLWGPPVASFPSNNCDISSHFFEHTLTLDTTICGDWAGPAYSSSGCPGTCGQAVANPANFKNAKWKVNFISVYK